MTMISKLRSVPLIIAPETQPDSNTVQQPALSVPSTGIANTDDGFESAEALNSGIFTFTQPQSSGDQMVQEETWCRCISIF